MTITKKVNLNLVGIDGNAFMIMTIYYKHSLAYVNLKWKMMMNINLCSFSVFKG